MKVGDPTPLSWLGETGDKNQCSVSPKPSRCWGLATGGPCWEVSPRERGCDGLWISVLFGGLGPLCAGASLTGLQWWEAEGRARGCSDGDGVTRRGGRKAQ